MSTPNSSRAIPLGVAADLFRQLSDLAEGGFTPAETVAVVKEDIDSPVIAGMLGEIAEDLKQQPSLARALERHRFVFGTETVAFVDAAERQDALAGGLAMLADDYERRQQLRVRLPAALLWPLFLLVFLILIVSLLMIFVIPAFQEVFVSFGSDLPGPTLAVIAISDLAVAYGWIPIAIIIALPLGIALLRRRESGLGAALDTALLKLPWVKRLWVKPHVGRMAALLAGATANRIPLPTTIAYLQSTLSNQSLKGTVAALGRDLEHGTPLSAAWRKHPLLPRKIAQMVDVGERSNKLTAILERAARIHDAETTKAIAVFRQVFFVTAYVVTGLIVAFVVIAMYLPIFILGGTV